MHYRKMIVAGAALLVGSGAQADTIYHQGFETDASGWNSAPIARVASGTNGIASNSGAYHAIITNDEDSYDPTQPGYGQAGYSRFGFEGMQAAYPGSPFSQSVAVYIDTATRPASNPGVPAFWIDASPEAAGANRYAGEHNFQLSYLGDSVSVAFDGQGTPVNLTNSGWYTFQFLYGRGANGNDPTSTTLNLLSGNTILGSTTLANNNGSPLLSDDLGGPFYLWFTVFQNGFSGNQLAIDDIDASTVNATGAVPEPATWAMMIAGFGMVGGAMRRRRTSVAFA